MTERTGGEGGSRGGRLRLAAWGAAVALILLPSVAMQITDEVEWGAADFGCAAALAAAVGVAYELAARTRARGTYRAAMAVALAAALILIWINLAVGIIGNEENPANMMYAGVLAAGMVAAIIGRFRPLGTARALFATALAQILVGAIAIIGRLGLPASGPLEIGALTGFFVVLWLLAAGLFRKAARQQTPAGTAP